MRKKYVVAYDLGTSSVKILFYSLEGITLASTTVNYPLYTNSRNEAEQSPKSYWHAVCEGTLQILREEDLNSIDCEGIAFGTQWRGIIPIDSGGNCLRRGIIWMDKRAGKQAKWMNHKLKETLFCESDYWPKLLWFREEEPELYEKSTFILEANAYLKWKATGKIFSDITNCYTRSCSSERQTFYQNILSVAGLDLKKFPAICRSTDLVGRISKEASVQMGLPQGTPVFGGCCDIAAVAIGSGCCRQGDVHAYLGTSGWLGCISPHQPTRLYSPPLDEKSDVSFYGLGVTVGPSTDWLIRQFYSEEKKTFGKNVWNIIGEELENTKPGSERLLIAPWFFGGRPPFSSGKARGVFVNLREEHTRAHMTRALLEGFCYVMRQNLEVLEKTEKKSVDCITVCGGGSNNRYWMQAMADILKIQIRVPRDTGNVGAVGVAQCALLGLGVRKNYEAVKSGILIQQIYNPNPENFQEYDLLYSQFQQLYGAMARIFERLN